MIVGQYQVELPQSEFSSGYSPFHRFFLLTSFYNDFWESDIKGKCVRKKLTNLKVVCLKRFRTGVIHKVRTLEGGRVGPEKN